jgi:hypothetical protein
VAPAVRVELRLPAAGRVSVVLLDHFASEEINAAAFDVAFDTDGTDPSLFRCA